MRLTILGGVVWILAAVVALAEPATREPLRSADQRGGWQLLTPQPAESAEVVAPPRVDPYALPLSWADLEAIALSRNPALLRAGARVAAARGNWLQVGLPPNPRIAYSAAEIGDEGRAGQQGGYVAQELITGGKLRLNRGIAAAELRAAEREFAAWRLRVMNDLAVAYYDVLAAQRMLEISHSLVAIADEGVSTTAALLKAGEVPPADELQAQIEAENARILRTTSANRLAATWRQLVAIAGEPALPRVEVAGELEGDLPELAWDEVLARLLTASPELAVAQAEIGRAEWRLRRAQAEPIPNLDMQAGVQYDDATNFAIANVQFELPVPIINRNQGGIRQAQAELIEARSSLNRLQLALQDALALAFERYQNAHYRAGRFQREILPRAQRNLELTTIAYRGQEQGYLSLLTAQRTYFHAQLDYIDALRQMRQSLVEIDGLLLRGSLQRPEPR